MPSFDGRGIAGFEPYPLFIVWTGLHCNVLKSTSTHIFLDPYAQNVISCCLDYSEACEKIRTSDLSLTGRLLFLLSYTGYLRILGFEDSAIISLILTTYSRAESCWWGLNSWPLRYEWSALPTELQQHRTLTVVPVKVLNEVQSCPRYKIARAASEIRTHDAVMRSTVLQTAVLTCLTIAAKIYEHYIIITLINQ